jgi:hypothetical protein
MNAPHAFPARPGRVGQGVPREWVEASDWFILFTLGTLLFLVVAFAVWAWLIWRRTTRPEPHVRLLMEMAEEEASARGQTRAAAEKPEPAEPWERPADWWKKSAD